jgi:monoamine oxidase
VTVLEAKSRIGGRVWTRHARVTPAPIELGAEFVHGDAPWTMRLVRAAGLAVAPSGGPMWSAQGGRVRPDDLAGSLARVFRLIDRRAPDEPFAHFLARRPGGDALAPHRAAVASFVEGFHAADLARIGTHALAPVDGHAAGGASTSALRILGDQEAIPRGLSEELEGVIRMRVVVAGIAWRRHEVRVRLQGEARRLRARAIVVTVPIGVIAAPAQRRGAIAFDPDPPAVRRAVGKLAMGSVTKVVFAFDELPWSKLPEVGFLRTPDSAFNVWWSAGSSAAPLAVAWSGGPRAAALDTRPPAEIVATAVRELARGLGVPRAKLAASVRGAWLHDWQHDPYSRGAYSYPGVGGANAGRALARPVEDTLFFAGEATSEAWGTVEGALASGMRAARQVDAALRR